MRMAIKKTTKATKDAVTESADKHWFPADAKPAAAPAAKKSPWQRKPVMVNYGTIAGPCYNMKEEFHKIIDNKYKKLTDEQRQALWSVVGIAMITLERTKLSEVIDQEIQKTLGSI